MYVVFLSYINRKYHFFCLYYLFNEGAHLMDDKNTIRRNVFDTKDQPVPIKDSIIDKLDVTEKDILELNEEVFEINGPIPSLKEYDENEEV